MSSALNAVIRRKTIEMPDLSKYVTLSDAAVMLGYNVESVRRLLREKKITGLKVGNYWLVEKTALEDFISKTRGFEKTDPRRGN